MTRRIQRLNIWMNGQYVGYWEKTQGEESLVYAQEWIENAQGRPLSLSLQLLLQIIRFIEAILSGTILITYYPIAMISGGVWQPDITLTASTLSIYNFELGRDCVGAIQLLANDTPPADLFSIQQQPLTEHGVARILRNSWSDNTFVRPEHNEDLRLSIAGAQEKKQRCCFTMTGGVSRWAALPQPIFSNFLWAWSAICKLI